MSHLLNQDEFLIKFKHFLNCKVLHHIEKIELRAGKLKNEMSIFDLKAHPEFISSISPGNAYQLGLVYGDLSEPSK